MNINRLLQVSLFLLGMLALSACFQSRVGDSLPPSEPDNELELLPATGIGNECLIEGSQGKIKYFSRAIGVLNGTLQLSGLRPDHTYALTLNGWSNHPSNDALTKANCGSPDICGSLANGEGFWNFQDVRTDKDGNAKDISFNVPLEPSDYSVKFFVKDREDPDWCVVLYHNSFNFSVQ